MRTATMNREQLQHEALSRAIGGQALTNWPAILAGFTAKAIPEDDIKPRENVFTYQAWRALGRQVRRGEQRGAARTGWPPGAFSLLYRWYLGSMLSLVPYFPRKATMKTILALAVVVGLLALGCGDATPTKKTEPAAVKPSPTPPKQPEESTHDRD